MITTNINKDELIKEYQEKFKLLENINKDIKTARQCMDYQLFKCDNRSCLNGFCPLHKCWDNLESKQNNEISLCNNCHCMTKTLETKEGLLICGKCKIVKNIETQSKQGCGEDCNCDCHIFIGGKGHPCPECSRSKQKVNLK